MKRLLQLGFLLAALLWCVTAHATFTNQAGGSGNATTGCTTTACTVSLTLTAGWAVTVEAFSQNTVTSATCCNVAACSVAWQILGSRFNGNNGALTYLCPSANAGTFAIGPTWNNSCISTGCGTSVQSWTSSLGTVAKDSGATPTAGCAFAVSSPEPWCALTVSANNHIFLAAAIDVSSNISACNPAGCTVSVNNGNSTGWIPNKTSYSGNTWTVSATSNGDQAAGAIMETSASTPTVPDDNDLFTLMLFGFASASLVGWRFGDDERAILSPRPPFSYEPDEVSKLDATNLIHTFDQRPEEDEPGFLGRPPFVFEPDEASKYDSTNRVSVYSQTQDEDEPGFVGAPPLAIMQDGEEQRFLGLVQLYDPAAEMDEPGAAPDPPVVQQDELEPGLWRGLQQIFHADEETQRQNAPTPPFVIQEDGENQRAIESKTWAPEDVDNTKTPSAPIVAPNIGLDDIESHFKTAEPVRTYHEDEWANTAPTPPVAIVEEPIDFWTGTQKLQHEDTETQNILPTPPVSIESDEISKWSSTAPIPVPDDAENYKTPPPPPVSINIGLDDLDTLVRDLGRYSFSLEDDLSTKAPTPPVVQQFEESEQRNVDVRSIQHEDTETQRGDPPRPPAATVDEADQKIDAGWRSRQYDDTETQRPDPPRPPVAPVDEADQKIDVDWHSRTHEDTETQRTLPPTPPQALDQDTANAQFVVLYGITLDCSPADAAIIRKELAELFALGIAIVPAVSASILLIADAIGCTGVRIVPAVSAGSIQDMEKK